ALSPMPYADRQSSMRFGDCAERQEFSRARVGEQDVQPAMALLDCTDEHVEILKIGDIAADSRRVASDLLDRSIEFRLAPASHDNLRALERQTLCRRKANAGGAASNEGYLAFVLRGVKFLRTHSRLTVDYCVSAAPR